MNAAYQPKYLTILDHLRDIGPLTAIAARETYGIGGATFRSVMRELRKVVQIESTDVVLDKQRYKQHALVK